MPDPKRPRSAAKAVPAATKRGSRAAKSTPPKTGSLRETAKEAAARAFAVAAARSFDDDKCSDTLVLDVRGRSQVTDYIVLATGSSDRQMRSSAHRVSDLGKASGFALFRSNKDDTNQTWFVLDFVDVVAHVFDPAARAYYDLEMLWGDAPRVDWRRPAPASTPKKAKGVAKRPAPAKRAPTGRAPARRTKAAPRAKRKP